jgi:hypothetical protein
VNLVALVEENPFLRALYNTVSALIEIVPFYVHRECLADDSELSIQPRLDNIEVGFLNPADIKMIALSEDVQQSEAELLHRLDDDCFQSYRGLNLAPFLRYQLYLHLTKMRRTKFFSGTLFLNTSAVRFKEKLRAQKVSLHVYTRFFKKFHFSIRLKNYTVDNKNDSTD